jgi:hypothetical protein
LRHWPQSFSASADNHLNGAKHPSPQASPRTRLESDCEKRRRLEDGRQSSETVNSPQHLLLWFITETGEKYE